MRNHVIRMLCVVGPLAVLTAGCASHIAPYHPKHRKLDPGLSTPHRPYHAHDEKWPLRPGEVVELDVEIWPTCIVAPRGYRLALTVRGKDYEWEGPAERLSNMKNQMRGCGPFVHDEPLDRPPEIFGGITTLHFGAERQAYVLLPVIQARQ